MKNLRRVLNLRRECERAEEKLSELETLSEKLTTNLSDMPHAGTPTPIDEWWARYIDQKDYYRAKLFAYVNAAEELEREIDGLKGDDIKLAMKYRFIDGMKITDIAEAMFFSERNIYYLLKRGQKQYTERY